MRGYLGIHTAERIRIAARAHTAVARAIRRGELTRQPCEECGRTEKVQAHHDDYARPLDVRWLCGLHHADLHREIRIAAWNALTPEQQEALA